MARLARVVAPGCAHHVTQRGNHQQTVFLSDSDRELYLRILRENSRKYGLRLLGFCLMTNHVHLIVIPDHPHSLARGLGRTHNDYARCFQVRSQQTGHLWQNRFYSCAMDEAHAWEALRYVELNPVRSGLVTSAWHWRWSSAAAHVTARDPSQLLDLTVWSQRFDGLAWRQALALGFKEAAWVERFRTSTVTGRPMASDSFVDELESKLGRKLRPEKRGPKRRRRKTEAAQLNFEVV